MREYSTVLSMIDKLVVELQQAHISHVDQVQFRRGINVAENVLRQAISLYSLGTPLEGATVTIQPATVVCYCECGAKRVFTVDQLDGHYWVCPRCESVLSTRDIPDLELVEIIAPH